MLRILDIRMEKFTVNLDRVKKTQYGHILIISLILFRDVRLDVGICLAQYAYVEAIMRWSHRVFHHRSICISLASIIIEPSLSQKKGGGEDWRWLESLMHKHEHMHTCSQ